MKRVYVAGPFTKGVCEQNVRAAILAGDRLLSAGLVPYVPHLNFLWGMVCPHDYEEWLALDMAWLSQCDAILRIPGESPGAEREIAFAESRGIPVFYHESRLLEWAFRGGPV